MRKQWIPGPSFLVSCPDPTYKGKSAIISTYFVKKPVRVHTVLMRSSHNSSTTSMATATTKKTRRLLKKEVMFTSRRLQLKLDLDVMDVVFVVKEMEAVESHVACYPEG